MRFAPSDGMRSYRVQAGEHNCRQNRNCRWPDGELDETISLYDGMSQHERVSALCAPLRFLRLCGESWLAFIHHREAETAEGAQGKPTNEKQGLAIQKGSNLRQGEFSCLVHASVFLLDSSLMGVTGGRLQDY